MRAALVQLCSSDDPVENLGAVALLIEDAVRDGAEFVLTPEVTNCVSLDRAHQRRVLTTEDADPVLAGLRDLAAKRGIWILLGSLALKTDDPDRRFANRSILIGPAGDIRARYDKIHMFDVAVSASETYRESAGYRPGDTAIVAEMPFGLLGMTICYDIRFPGLYRHLAKAGAGVITVPSAFSPVTGATHWEPLLRARAIECGAYILAPAQCGTHKTRHANARRTHGHSLAVSPWGEVLADAAELPGVVMVDIDADQIISARARIPALTHDRPFEGP